MYAIACKNGRYQAQRVTYLPSGASDVQPLSDYLPTWADARNIVAAIDSAAAANMKNPADYFIS